MLVRKGSPLSIIMQRLSAQKPQVQQTPYAQSEWQQIKAAKKEWSRLMKKCGYGAAYSLACRENLIKEKFIAAIYVVGCEISSCAPSGDFRPADEKAAALGLDESQKRKAAMYGFASQLLSASYTEHAGKIAGHYGLSLQDEKEAAAYAHAHAPSKRSMPGRMLQMETDFSLAKPQGAKPRQRAGRFPDVRTEQIAPRIPI
ncbi:Uncharacterised protein [Candidatus Anstonella stagnisolia]|nr:Uncharacterised protein [Candidatus Anstonella stagnisolia]